MVCLEHRLEHNVKDYYKCLISTANHVFTSKILCFGSSLDSPTLKRRAGANGVPGILVSQDKTQD